MFNKIQKKYKKSNENNLLIDNCFLLHQVDTVLQKIGSDKFFSDPNQKTQRAREGFAEFFFMSAYKKLLGKNLWIIQPTDIFPDFYLLTINEEPADFNVIGFELVEIPTRCQSFNEAFGIVESKIKKGYPENYNLLIYINHKNSIQWVDLLGKKIHNYYPFNQIWTIHLLFKNQNEIEYSVVNKIRPLPIKKIEVYFNEKEIYQKQFIPKIMDKYITNDGIKVTLKQEFMNEVKKTSLKKKKNKRLLQ